MATILRQQIDRFLEQHLNDGHRVGVEFIRRDGEVVELRVTATPNDGDQEKGWLEKTAAA